MGPETAVLPKGWEKRLVAVKNENTNDVTGYCLDVHDLAISKIVSGRPKDLEFIHELVRHEMISHQTMLKRLAGTELSDAERHRITSRIDLSFRK